MYGPFHMDTCVFIICVIFTLFLYMFFCRLCVHRVRVCLCVHSGVGVPVCACVSRVWVCLYVLVCENTRKLLTAFFYQVDQFF